MKREGGGVEKLLRLEFGLNCNCKWLAGVSCGCWRLLRLEFNEYFKIRLTLHYSKASSKTSNWEKKFDRFDRSWVMLTAIFEQVLPRKTSIRCPSCTKMFRVKLIDLCRNTIQLEPHQFEHISKLFQINFHPKKNAKCGFFKIIIEIANKQRKN